LVGKPEGKRPLGRPRHRWEDNIKMNLREIGIDGANWIRLGVGGRVTLRWTFGRQGSMGRIDHSYCSQE
jgi:hypothetical protein